MTVTWIGTGNLLRRNQGIIDGRDISITALMQARISLKNGEKSNNVLNFP